MQKISMTCAECGASMNMDKKYMFCPYCGSKSLLEEDNEVKIAEINAKYRSEETISGNKVKEEETLTDRALIIGIVIICVFSVFMLLQLMRML